MFFNSVLFRINQIHRLLSDFVRKGSPQRKTLFCAPLVALSLAQFLVYTVTNKCSTPTKNCLSVTCVVNDSTVCPILQSTKYRTPMPDLSSVMCVQRHTNINTIWRITVAKHLSRLNLDISAINLSYFYSFSFVILCLEDIWGKLSGFLMIGTFNTGYICSLNFVLIYSCILIGVCFFVHFLLPRFVLAGKKCSLKSR